jgi:hypothetical protein
MDPEAPPPSEHQCSEGGRSSRRPSSPNGVPADPLSADWDFCCPSAGRFVSVYREPCGRNSPSDPRPLHQRDGRPHLRAAGALSAPRACSGLGLDSLDEPRAAPEAGGDLGVDGSVAPPRTRRSSGRRTSSLSGRARVLGMRAMLATRRTQSGLRRERSAISASSRPSSSRRTIRRSSGRSACRWLMPSSPVR